MLRSALAVSALTFLPSLAGAQIIRMPSSSSAPPIAVSASVGLLRSQRIVDGSTASSWNFGSALLYRGTIEKTVTRDAAVGLAVGYASMPMLYVRTEQVDLSTPCNLRCDATGDFYTIQGTFRAGGGYGFHQVLEIGVGLNVYTNFREEASGASLAPSSADKDFSFSLGYGFGYGFGARAQIAIVQDAAFGVHQRSGTAGNVDTVNQQYTTRLVFRLAVGR